MATIHVHPTLAASPLKIRAVEAKYGLQVIWDGQRPQVVQIRRPTQVYRAPRHPFGGDAA